MAVDVFTSPRISFSRDLEELDSRPVLESIHNPRSDSFLSNPTIDFDFDFCIDFTHKISSADELFANGQILPVEIKRNTHPPEPIRVISSGNLIPKKKKRLIEFLSNDHEEDEIDQKRRPTNPKSLWQFGRSSSASVENGLPRIRPLTRSKSTGSVANPNKPNKAINNRYYYYNYYYPYITKNINTTSSQRPPLRKSSNGGGVRIDPVLNIIPARAALTLFASFFRANSSKNKRS